MATEEQIHTVLQYMYVRLSCPECGTRFQFGDLECPHCGADFEEVLRTWAAMVVDALEGEDGG